jgi:hypothetical protein
MTTLTVNIENEKDLPVLQEILDRFGLDYCVEKDTDDELEASLKPGLAEADAGLGKPMQRLWHP